MFNRFRSRRARMEKEKRAGFLPPSRNQPFRNASATALPSGQSLIITTKPANMAARLAVPMSRVAIIMFSPPLVVLSGGESKNVALGFMELRGFHRAQASGEFRRGILCRNSVRGEGEQRHRGRVHRPGC
jgi:hypothetical protein